MSRSPVDLSASSPSSLPGSAPAQPEVEIRDHYRDASRWSTFHRIAYRVRRDEHSAWIAQEREFLDRGDAIALLPYCPETGQVLLTRQFRMPIWIRRPEESMLLECCGGILDNPDPTVTLRHEAVEELGIELHSFEQVFAAYSTPGSVCEKVWYYIAPYAPEQRLHKGGGLALEGEDIEVLEMPLHEALEGLKTGVLQDVRTVALVLYLATMQPDLVRISREFSPK